MTNPILTRLETLMGELNRADYTGWADELCEIIADIAAMTAAPVTVRVLVNVVWRPYETHKIHDGYGGFSGESVDGEFHAFFNDGSSLVWRYSPEVKHECWMDTGWPGIIPLRNESEVPDAEK